MDSQSRADVSGHDSENVSVFRWFLAFIAVVDYDRRRRWRSATSTARSTTVRGCSSSSSRSPRRRRNHDQDLPQDGRRERRSGASDRVALRARVRRTLGRGTAGDPSGGRAWGRRVDLGRRDDADAGRRRGPGGRLSLHRGDHRRGRGHRWHQASRGERRGGKASARRRPRRGQARPPLVRLLEKQPSASRQAVDRRGPRGEQPPGSFRRCPPSRRR